jgi:pantothenate kinase
VPHPDRDHDQAILVGLDGWHLTRAQLDVFPDPQAAHDRRGSHWTFDGAGYVKFLRQLRETTNPSTVLTAPSFDHALKDPTPDAVTIHPYHRIVLIEGLYMFLAIHPWSDGGFLLDERWFVEIDLAEARRRLVDRHLVTGVAKDRTEAEWRADANDVPSASIHQLILAYPYRSTFSLCSDGQFIIANMLEPTRVIHSKDIPSLSRPSLDDVETAAA